MRVPFASGRMIDEEYDVGVQEQHEKNAKEDSREEECLQILVSCVSLNLNVGCENNSDVPMQLPKMPSPSLQASEESHNP